MNWSFKIKAISGNANMTADFFLHQSPLHIEDKWLGDKKIDSLPDELVQSLLLFLLLLLFFMCNPVRW